VSEELEELEEIINAAKDPQRANLRNEAWLSADMATDPGETLLAAAWGSIEGMGSGCIGVTNRRILLTPGFISGIGFYSGEIGLGSIRGVTPQRDHRLAIDCGSKVYTITIGYDSLEAFEEVFTAIQQVLG